jgi:uncharacterized protein DUF5723
MKKTAFIFMCMHSCLCLLAQQNLGIRNSNYAGIQGALLNPSSIADSKLEWDVNVFSGGEVFDNTFLYAPKSSLSLFGFKKIIEGSIHEDLFDTHFDSQDPNKLYNVTFSTEILGPSFFVKVAKKYEIGFTMAGRSYANIKDISGNMAQNAFAYLLEKDLWNTTFHDNTARLNSMGWLEYGLHFATVIYSNGRDELKVGISLNYLQGIAAAYFKNTNITYKIVDTTNIAFTNTSIDYGRTDIDTYKKINSYNDLNQGHGFGMDIGFTYVHLTAPAVYSVMGDAGIQGGSDKTDYVYRLGISLIDIGSINFNRNTAAFHLQAEEANFENWHQSKFANNAQLDQTLSAVFYQGDSAKSLTSDHFNMALPSALSIQADWNIYQHFFANTTIIKGFGHGSKNGVTRPDVYSLTPRYETKWFEVSVPMSLLYYNHLQPRIGLAMRAGYFFIGGDAPGSLLKLNDLEGVDFYAGVHFFIAKKSKNH